MVFEQDETAQAITRLREQIRQLTDEQSEALRRATYVGMTAEEAKVYDARRAKITRLIQQIADMQKAL